VSESIAKTYFVVTCLDRDKREVYAKKQDHRGWSGARGKRGSWGFVQSLEDADEWNSDVGAKKAARGFLKSTTCDRHQVKIVRVVKIEEVVRQTTYHDVFSKAASIVDLVATQAV
jgi:hypothetical protein